MLLRLLIWSCMWANGSARVPRDTTTAADLGEAALANDTSIADMLRGYTPDCDLLGHPVDEDPRWDFETAHLAKCECWMQSALKKCRVTIPNDHIFNERNRAKKAGYCGKSVYDKTPRGPTGKSGRNCISDHLNVARIQWKNGAMAKVKYIKKGFDEGTCYQFKDVPCVDVKDEPHN